MYNKIVVQIVIGLFACSYSSPVIDQVSDRLVAGQLMILSRNGGLYQYSDYWNNTGQTDVWKYMSDCNWGFYIRVNKETKEPVGGLVIKF